MITIDLIIFTDLWKVRGSRLSDFLRSFVDTAYENRNTVRVFSPSDCLLSVPVARYAEERISLSGFFAIRRILKRNKFKAIYIPTPNLPIGIYARLACKTLGLHYYTNERALYPSYLREWLSQLAPTSSQNLPVGELSANLLSIMTR